MLPTLAASAGIPAVVHPDLESWLRTHAALVVPLMIAANRSHQRQAGISWAEAGDLSRARREGFEVVRALGHAITPAPMVVVGRLPGPLVTGLLWAVSRVPAIRRSGASGPSEPRALIDEMTAAAPGRTAALLAVRP